MLAEYLCPSHPLHTSRVCSCFPVPLTSDSPSTLLLILLVLLVLEYVSFAFFVALEMASAEAGVICPCPLPKLQFLSRYISNKASALSFWINTLTTVLLFQAGHQCFSALTSWCVAVPLPFPLSPALPVHVRSIQPGILQKWDRTALHQVLGVAKCRWKGVSRECESRECPCN